LETIRYYEREGLLPKPPRTAAGYRLFPSDTAKRLRFIKRAQELGFPLSEIRELRARAEVKIKDIEQKICTLAAIKRALRNLTNRCEACGPLNECPILESLDGEVAG
jgi:MerR family mercuric resistance operon transcriptional regulator